MEGERIIEEYLEYLGAKDFPCVAARAAVSKDHIRCIVADHMACPKDDRAILSFLYNFVDDYRKTGEPFYSAAVIFRQPQVLDEKLFDQFLWTRLKALATLDKENYGYDPRVDADPVSGSFSFSLKEEAFFIVGLHPSSSRQSRQFKYPTLAFNPHAQFEKLRRANQYERMKKIVRKRDIVFSGSVNPMLKDFGEASEVYQYSGIQYDSNWKCPLENRDAKPDDHSTP